MSNSEAPQPDPQHDALAQTAQFVDGVAQDLPEMGPAQDPLDSLQHHVDDPQVALRAHLGAATDNMSTIVTAIQARERQVRETRRRFAAIVGEPSLDPVGRLRRERLRTHRDEMVRRSLGSSATRGRFMARAATKGQLAPKSHQDLIDQIRRSMPPSNNE